LLQDRPIPLLDLILSICDATELINPKINQHGKRVAYIALNIADELGLDNFKKHDIILAGLLHDIGAFSLKEKLEALTFDFELNNTQKEINRHGLLGYKLLNYFKPFSKIALIIKYHHFKLGELEKDCKDEEIALASQIIHLADRVDVLIENEKEILGQVKSIVDTIEKYKMDLFNNDLVDTLKTLAIRECFWFDAVSNPQINTFTRKLGQMPIDFGLDKISDFAKMFSYIIDFRSPFTSTHSSGVTAAASSIAEFMGLSPRECEMMKVAGYLHDLGKLSVSAEILNKPSSLTDDEFKIIRGHTYYTYQILDRITNLDLINSWASFHHEKLDGSGYPFHLKGDQLSIGSRIMAVADNFTAIAEDRPYRKGLDRKSVIKILEDMAQNNKIDDNVVAIVKQYFDDINLNRLKAQNGATKEYKELGNFYL
jgi:putative nucleotidyltransferase with HDIG domain